MHLRGQKFRSHCIQIIPETLEFGSLFISSLISIGMNKNYFVYNAVPIKACKHLICCRDDDGDDDESARNIRNVSGRSDLYVTTFESLVGAGQVKK